MSETTTTAPPHWLLGLCDPERANWGPPTVGAILAHPWLWTDPDGRTWTVATDAKTIHLFLGQHGIWPTAGKDECRMLAPFLGPSSGDLFAWEPFARWLGPDAGRVPCSECKGTRKVDTGGYFVDELEQRTADKDGMVPCPGCTDGTEPAPPRRGRLRGAVLNRNLLARGIEAAVRLFEEPDLCEVALAMSTPPPTWARYQYPPKPDLTGPVTVQTAGVPLWKVVVMPLTPQTEDDQGPAFPETT